MQGKKKKKKMPQRISRLAERQKNATDGDY